MKTAAVTITDDGVELEDEWMTGDSWHLMFRLCGGKGSG
jgi:hypothetical protein